MPAENKRKGYVGEAKCLAKMVELGVPVSNPFGDNERYDMIIEHNNTWRKYRLNILLAKSEMVQ